MNLIHSPWLDVIRMDGTSDTIAPWQIAETDNPVIEVTAPRPDFHGALYQFLIGLLQTTYAPENEDEWFDRWEQIPDIDDVKSAFASVAEAFELVSTNGPAFLQDFDLPEGEQKPVSGLLIEAPGGKTLKDNLDHFVKGDIAKSVCKACAASALFTLQTNAPSGGVGHRVGLRGGGPLTTLVQPQNPESPLWNKLWLNVLTQEKYSCDHDDLSEIFPWMATTRLSDKSGGSTMPEDTHPLQMYWGMPRRIRLQVTEKESACSLCGRKSSHQISHYITRNYGVNYEGPWLHPLTPYRIDPKNKKPPLSLKGQEGGLGYRHWLGLSLQDKAIGDRAAETTTHYQTLANEFPELSEQGMRLWCFGYDMDNMKARCWYDHQMPVLAISDSYRDLFIDFITTLLAAAKDTVALLRGQVKAAWFSRPKDAKGDTSIIDQSFWDMTEARFYSLLHQLAKQPDNTSSLPPNIAKQWVTGSRRCAYNLFDHWVLEGEADDMDMKRITAARRLLNGKLKTIKSLKTLDQLASAEPHGKKQEVV